MSDPSFLPFERPNNWEAIDAKWLFEETSSKGYPSEQPLSASQAFGVVPQEHLESALERQVMVATKGWENFKLVMPDDFVISLRSFEGGLEHSMYRGIISPAYSVVRPRDARVYPGFYRYYLKSDEFISRLQAVATGIRDGKTIRYDAFAELQLPLPPKSVQVEITRFLDHTTNHIDTLVGKKQRQLKLLEEKHTALITQAVTKGLNPNVKMKDSGVEWLGEVPAQWEVASVKRLAGISYGLGQPPKEIENGIALIRATDISRGAIDLSKCLRVDPNDVPAGRNAFLKPGDIIVVRSGAYTGDSALVPDELAGAVAGYDMIVRCSNCTSQFMAYVLLSSLMAYQITMAASRAAQDHLNAEQLGNCTLALPPVEEQLSIVRYLDGATTRIDALKRKIQHSIELLQEYRSALISAAVTGQIDVREEVM